MGKLLVVGCGGAGINIVKGIESVSEAGYAEFDTLLIDTSRSNLTDTMDPSKVYLFEGVDGSGKLRSSNYESIAERSRELVQKIGHPDAVIVIHSGSGGSGSIIAPVIVNELMSRNQQVMVMMIGSVASRIEIENTIKTIKSYAAISQQHVKPIPMVYEQNSVEQPRSKVDQIIKTNLAMVGLFFSGSNKELDSADLQNFLNYTKVTSYPHGLTKLEFFDGKLIRLQRDEVIFSAVTLTDHDSQSNIDHPIGYQAVGFIPETVKRIAELKMPIHMVQIGNAHVSSVDELSQLLKKYEDAANAVIHRSLVDHTTPRTEKNIVL